MPLPALPPRRIVVWWLVSALPLAVVVAIGAYLSYHYHALLKESRDRVDHTYETLDALRRLFESVQDAETAQRGFIITGEERYLAPLAAALQSAPKSYAALHALAPRGSADAEQVERLKSLVTAELGALQRGIDLRRGQGLEAARLQVSEGKSLMDELRVQTTAMVAAERASLLRARDEAYRKERNTWRVAGAVAALSIATRIGIAVWLFRRRRHRS